MEPLAELKERLAEIADVQRAQYVLGWDMEVWMPPGGQKSRAIQLATLETIAHARQTDDRIGELLDELEPYRASLPADSDDACLLRAARHDFDKLRRVPASSRARSCRSRPRRTRRG